MNWRFSQTGFAILIILISMVSNCATSADLQRTFTYEQKYDSNDLHEKLADIAIAVPENDFEDWVAGVDDDKLGRNSFLRVFPRLMSGMYYGIGKGIYEMVDGPITALYTQNNLECSKVYGMFNSARCRLYQSSGNVAIDSLLIPPKIIYGYFIQFFSALQHSFASFGMVFLPKTTKTIANRRDEVRGDFSTLRSIHNELPRPKKQELVDKSSSTGSDTDSPTTPQSSWSSGSFFKYQVKSAKYTVKVDGKEQE